MSHNPTCHCGQTLASTSSTYFKCSCGIEWNYDYVKGWEVVKAVGLAKNIMKGWKEEAHLKKLVCKHTTVSWGDENDNLVCEDCNHPVQLISQLQIDHRIEQATKKFVGMLTGGDPLRLIRNLRKGKCRK